MKRIVVACILAWAAPNAFGCDVVGVLDGLALAKIRVKTVDKTQSWIERGTNKVDIKNGMPLCRADRLITADDVSAILLLGSAGSSQKQITVSPHSNVHLLGDSKVELLGGGIFAQVKGVFDAIFALGDVASAGTLFSVEINATGAHVVQLEDATVFTGRDAAAGSVVTVPARAEVSLQSSAVQAVPKEMPFDRCKAVTDPNSEIVSETRAKRPSLPVSRHFGPETIGKVFADARASMLCSTKQAEAAAARERVGLIYVDWADPAQALRLLDSSPSGSTPEAQARHFTAIGNALRIEGQPEQALEQYRKALSVVANYAPAENGMGDALRDQGVKASGNTVSAKQKASDLFEAARKSYEQAANHGTGTPEFELAMVNHGNLLLLWSGLFPERGDQLVDSAQSLFDQALTQTQGRSLQARLGLARVEMQRAQLIPKKEVDPTGLKPAQVFAANLIYLLQAENERRPAWSRAEVILNALVNDEPDFAPGMQTLGELYLLSSSSKRAEEVLLRAMSADPRHTITYSFLARAARHGGDDYAAAYKAVEFPAMRAIADAKRKLSTRQAPTVTVPSNLLIPDVSTLRFEAAGAHAARTIVFKNAGATAVTPTSVAIKGADAGAFVVRNDGCSSKPVAPEGSCRIVVVFQAQKPDSYKATLEVSTGGSISATVDLRGRISALDAVTYSPSHRGQNN